MIGLVVCMHACVTYSHVGDWYYMSAQEPPMPVKVAFVFWQGHLQSFFMGLLFLLSGYFAHLSLSRRGPARFLKERLMRLGLPTLFYMAVIHPFILLGLNPWGRSFPPVFEFYASYLATGRILGSSGPLWFAFALLLFCVVLAGWRAFRPVAIRSEVPAATPEARHLWLLAASLAVVTFIVRTVQPIGTSVLNFQLCFFPQYIAAFLLGVLAARQQWLLPLAHSRTAARAGWLGLLGGPLVLLTVILLGGPAPEHGPAAYNGGWHWQAFGLAAWEQFSGVALALGVLHWTSRLLDVDTAGLRWAADRSFAVYVLHAPILVGLAVWFRPLESSLSPFALAPLLTVTGLAASYGLSDLARRLPGLRAIL